MRSPGDTTGRLQQARGSCSHPGPAARSTVAALRVEAVVQAAEGVVHLRLEHRLMAEDCYTKL